MRRTSTPSKKYEHSIYREWPVFFWKTCCKCKQEFRRERGWRFLSGPYYNGGGHWRYLCSTCAPTREAANHLALDGVYIPPRPPAPPVAEPRVS